MLSVVIPVRDGGDQIEKMLRSLAAQTLSEPWELVIADNGSTDDTVAEASALSEMLPNLRVIDAGERRGRHHACNRGVAASTGAAVVFLDADDEVAPTFLEAMHAALEHHDIVAPRLDHRRYEHGEPVDLAWQADGLGETPFLPTASGAGLGARRYVLDAIGGFDETMDFCEDIDLSWRAQLAGYTIAFEPAAVVRYQQRGSAGQMFRQHRRYGAAWVLLRRKFAHQGMPGRSIRTAVTEWWTIVKAVPRLTDPHVRLGWVRRTGRAVGRLQGSLKYRTLYL